MSASQGVRYTQPLLNAGFPDRTFLRRLIAGSVSAKPRSSASKTRRAAETAGLAAACTLLAGIAGANVYFVLIAIGAL